MATDEEFQHMRDDVDRALTALYIAVDARVADDVGKKVRRLLAAYEEREKERRDG